VRNYVQRCCAIEAPRVAPVARGRSGSRRRAEQRQAVPTPRWSHRSNSDPRNNSQQPLRTLQRIRAAGFWARPSNDGRASRGGLPARGLACACSAWLAAGQRKASPSVRRPERASPAAEIWRSSEKLPTFAGQHSRNSSQGPVPSTPNLLPVAATSWIVIPVTFLRARSGQPAVEDNS